MIENFKLGYYYKLNSEFFRKYHSPTSSSGHFVPELHCFWKEKKWRKCIEIRTQYMDYKGYAQFEGIHKGHYWNNYLSFFEERPPYIAKLNEFEVIAIRNNKIYRVKHGY